MRTTPLPRGWYRLKMFYVGILQHICWGLQNNATFVGVLCTGYVGGMMLRDLHVVFLCNIVLRWPPCGGRSFGSRDLHKAEREELCRKPKGPGMPDTLITVRRRLPSDSKYCETSQYMKAQVCHPFPGGFICDGPQATPCLPADVCCTFQVIQPSVATLGFMQCNYGNVNSALCRANLSS